MTQQLINIGTAPNAGDGDPLRTSFTKTNDNFTEVYGYSVDLSGVSNATQARANLGLGGMATRGASAVAITGGAVRWTARPSARRSPRPAPSARWMSMA
jgi:hypothetical protein